MRISDWSSDVCSSDLPLLAVASHAHFDHIGNHHEFAERAIHRAEAEIMASPTRGATLADLYVTDEIFTALPPGDYDSARTDVAPAPARAGARRVGKERVGTFSSRGGPANQKKK